MILIRKGDEVFHEGVKLTIVKQETKGPGKEVVKISGLKESNGQKWVSLARLKEGENTIDCQGREVVATSRYSLTPDESARVKVLQAELDEIISKAKARYVAKPNLNVDPSKMTEEERLAKIAEITAYYGLTPEVKKGKK